MGQVTLNSLPRQFTWWHKQPEEAFHAVNTKVVQLPVYGHFVDQEHDKLSMYVQCVV